MMSRFRIEDLISQDGGSVVYLGVDEKTGERAALRRFFLTEGGSDGIAQEDQESFVEAMALLQQLDHPCLRRVLEGGLDEVDGVPYAATEWVEGEYLRDVLAEGPISEEAGELLVRQGLDVMEHLESFFGDGAHWLKLNSNSVIVREKDERVSFTFSVSLDRWMGLEDGAGGMDELATLVEGACGLNGSGTPGGGALKEWCRHVREGNPGVAEARGALDFIVQKHEGGTGSGPSLLVGPAAGQAAGPATAPPPPSITPLPPPKTGMGIKVALTMIVLAVAVAGFLVVKSRGDGKDPAVATVVQVEDEAPAAADEPLEVVEEPVEDAVSEEGPDLPVVAAAEPVAAEPAAGEREPEPVVEEPEPTVAFAGEEPVDPVAEGIAEKALRMREELQELRERTEFLANEGALLSTRAGDEVTVIGTVHHVRETGSTLVFEFTRDRGPDVLCVRMRKKTNPGATMEGIREYKGRQVRFRGTIGHYSTGKYERVFLSLASLDDLTE